MDFRSVISLLKDASATETLVSEVSSRAMNESTPALPTDRLAIGQLLVRLLAAFRAELFDDPQLNRFADVRFPHLQIWGNVGIDGIRLTDLAHRANLSLAACSELVNELQELGYLERRPDDRDGRAKLIFPTRKGRRVLDEAGRGVARIEARWRSLCAASSFDAACTTFDSLLRALAPDSVPVDGP
jgi:DNA-binding MarR family transcriptional regulator